MKKFFDEAAYVRFIKIVDNGNHYAAIFRLNHGKTIDENGNFRDFYRIKEKDLPKRARKLARNGIDPTQTEKARYQMLMIPRRTAK